MKIEIQGARVIAIREEADGRFCNESALWFALRNVMRAHGHDVVKRLTSRDGHLMGDNRTYYLRDRKWQYAIVDNDWQVRLVHEDWNETGRVVLSRVDWS